MLWIWSGNIWDLWQRFFFLVTLLPAWCSCQHYWKRSWFVSFFWSVTMKVCVNPSKLEYIVGKKQNQCSYIMVTYLAHNKISLITFEVRVLFVLAVLVLECTTLRRWFQPSYHLDQCQASTWIFSAHLSELLLMSYEARHPFSLLDGLVLHSKLIVWHSPALFQSI